MSDHLRLWLESIGLRQYADIFATNDIDLYVLRDLSDEDLKDLGLSLGHRRRLRRALAELADTPLPLGPTSTSSEGARIVGDPERRQLTVLFCDLVGSTELSQRLDPEDFARADPTLSGRSDPGCDAPQRLHREFPRRWHRKLFRLAAGERG